MFIDSFCMFTSPSELDCCLRWYISSNVTFTYKKNMHGSNTVSCRIQKRTLKSVDAIIPRTNLCWR